MNRKEILDFASLFQKTPLPINEHQQLLNRSTQATFWPKIILYMGHFSKGKRKYCLSLSLKALILQGFCGKCCIASRTICPLDEPLPGLSKGTFMPLSLTLQNISIRLSSLS